MSVPDGLSAAVERFDVDDPRLKRCFPVLWRITLQGGAGERVFRLTDEGDV